MINKKGVSEMVGYVLLIIIAVSISIVVFNFISKSIRTDDTPQCTEDVNLIVREAQCYSYSDNHRDISITLINKGLWSVQTAYVKVGAESSGVKELTLLQASKFPNPDGELKPGQSISLNMSTSSGSIVTSPNPYELEVEPIQKLESGKRPLCMGSVIRVPVTCIDA